MSDYHTLMYPVGQAPKIKSMEDEGQVLLGVATLRGKRIRIYQVTKFPVEGRQLFRTTTSQTEAIKEDPVAWFNRRWAGYNAREVGVVTSRRFETNIYPDRMILRFVVEES